MGDSSFASSAQRNQSDAKDTSRVEGMDGAQSAVLQSGELNGGIEPPRAGINLTGFIDHQDGANIRTGPAELGGEPLTSRPLAGATRVFVSGRHPQTSDWWYVSADSPEGVVQGYVQHFRLNTQLPEPTARLYKIRSGDTAEALSVAEFSDHIEPGHDLRFYQNVLLHVNQQAGRGGVRGSFQSPNIVGGGANNVQLVANELIWLVSPSFARSLKGVVPDGSLTNGAYGQAKQALAHIGDLITSVTLAPQVAASVAGEYLQAILDHLPEIIGVVSLFIAAESAAAFLAATPTGVGQLAALVIQMILAVMAGAGAVQAGAQALQHAGNWLRTAWTADGDQAVLLEAAKEFVRMLVMIAMAALAVAGMRGNVGNANTLAGNLKFELPTGATPGLVTPSGVVVGGSSGGLTSGGAVTLDAGLLNGVRGGSVLAMAGKGGGGGPVLKWGNPRSKPTYGHTFLDHGRKLKPQQLTDRARSKGHQVGQWTDDAAAADFVGNVAQAKGPGVHDVPVGAPGRSFLPDGTEVQVDMARIVVKPDGSVRTAFPYSSAHPN